MKSKNILIKILGSGTSTGVPLVGCNCNVCKSNNFKDKRLRTSILVNIDNLKLLIDTSNDLREQCLKNDILDIDAVIYTHHHFDHIAGFDDLRAFNFAKNKSVPIYLMQETLDNLKDVFKYAFSNEPNLSSSPKVNCTIIDIEEFSIKDITITPIPLLHGNMRVNGYRIQNFAYCTDCNVISEDSIQKLQNLDILILDGLRYSKHQTHFSINESIEIAKKLNANKTFLTHISHDVSHQITENELPENIYLAYDGLELKL